jgi:hypothetical protein
MGYRGSDDRATVTTSGKSEGLVKKSVSYRIEVFGENFFFFFSLLAETERCRRAAHPLTPWAEDNE